MTTTTAFVFAQSKAGKTDTAAHATFYSCPHHPDVVSEVPGKCSKCGMDLTIKKAGAEKNQ